MDIEKTFNTIKEYSRWWEYLTFSEFLSVVLIMIFLGLYLLYVTLHEDK
ncbi:hypothetical protein [Acinetobacter bereziniae]|nr:hypothetical protein [Acinetobacter bereziniae]